MRPWKQLYNVALEGAFQSKSERLKILTIF